MVQMYGVALRDTVQLQFWKQKNDFHFLHKPIVYGVTHLLYGVALSDSVFRLYQRLTLLMWIYEYPTLTACMAENG